MTIRVLVADDEPLITAGISFLLDATPDLEVITQTSVDSVVEAAAKQCPDVVVVDLPPERIGVIREITVGGGVRVVLLISRPTVSLVRDALVAGAAGCLLKATASSTLVGVVRATTATGAWLDPAIIGELLRELAGLPKACSVVGQHPPLTPREQEVLVLVAQGLSNLEIADRLYISALTVRTHVGRVMNKLGARNRAHAVTTAYRTGVVAVTHPAA